MKLNSAIVVLGIVAPAISYAGNLDGNVFSIESTAVNMGAESTYHGDIRTASVTWEQGIASQGSFSAKISSTIFTDQVSLGGYLHLYVDEPQNSQLRISYWSFQGNLQITRLSDGFKVASYHFEKNGDQSTTTLYGGSFTGSQSIPMLASDYLITGNYSFNPGHYLSPSFDPSCASIACMTVSADNAKLMAGVTATVPEPASYALLLLGAVGLAAVRRRG